MSKYKEYAEKPTEILALTGYIRQEFDALLPHFSRCYYDRMKKYRLDVKPRGKRKYSDYKNSPLPTMEDKLFFILNYLKTNNLQTIRLLKHDHNDKKLRLSRTPPGTDLSCSFAKFYASLTII